MKYIAALLALWLSGNAAATSVLEKPLEALLQKADIVVRARVTGVDMVDGQGRPVTDPQARTGPGLDNQLWLALRVDQVLYSRVPDLPRPLRVPLWRAWHHSLEDLHAQALGTEGVFLLTRDYAPVYPAHFQRSLDELPRIQAWIAQARSPAACTGERLRPWLAPTGVRAAWPIAAQLPAGLREQPGWQLDAPGELADGYTHQVLVDAARNAAYVLQRGGFTGGETVYGPLPVAACPPG